MQLEVGFRRVEGTGATLGWAGTKTVIADRRGKRRRDRAWSGSGVLCVASLLAGVLLQSRGWQLRADWSVVTAPSDGQLPPVCRIGQVVGLFLPDECASTAR